MRMYITLLRSAMRFPNIMLRIARISRRRSEAATFEVTERKATTGVGESESKRGFLTSFSHSKPCMRLSSRTAPKNLSNEPHSFVYVRSPLMKRGWGKIDDCIFDALLVHHLRILNWLIVNSPRAFTRDYRIYARY
uniref:Uncharacterized protein n=1 Tax=Spirodela intermedia TaxID=51605 RepID=A0A8S0XAA4_SPIIN